MSKIGKQPILIPQGVTIDIFDSQIKVLGPKGELSFQFHPQVKVETLEGKVKVFRKSETKFAKSLHGLTRSIIANMVKGVFEGHQKTLEIIGIGYRATTSGDDLVLNVGYSHPVTVSRVAGVEVEIRDNKIILTGTDKAAVGEYAAKIRRVRPPEPYKGKGIKYADEVIRRKAGKAVKAAEGGI